MSYILCEKIRNLKPYEPGTGDYRIRLDANESFLELSESTMKGILDRIRHDCINRYPDPLASEVCSRFADYYGVDAGFVTAGNGSDELLSVITQAFLMRGETMTVLSEDFSMYGFYGSIAEAEVDVFPKRSDSTIDVDGLIHHVNSVRSRILLFSNPCNPTGLGLPASDIMSIVTGCPDCLVIVDEAYMDFWDQSVIRNVANHDNMMVLKTCSKALRTAGIRCGFAVASETLTNALRAVKSPYNLNKLTQSAAAEMLSHPEEIDNAIRAVIESRDALSSELRRLQAECGSLFDFQDTAANFFMLHFSPDMGQTIFKRLQEDGILVRHFAGGRIRITVGSDFENAELIKSLRNIIQEEGAIV